MKRSKTLHLNTYPNLRSQKRATYNTFKYIPLEIWYIIFRFYLLDYERYRFLFVCKSFNALIKRLELLPEHISSKFRRKKYYFIVLNGVYYYGQATSFVIMNFAERRTDKSIRPVYHPRWRFDEKKFFMYATTLTHEIELFFKKYCMPIHYVQLENKIAYPQTVRNIIKQNFDYVSNRKIRWIHQRDSPIINLKHSNFDIKHVYFYNSELQPSDYIEIYNKHKSLTRLIANSFGTNFVLKCYNNFCIVDVLLSSKDRSLFIQLKNK